MLALNITNAQHSSAQFSSLDTWILIQYGMFTVCSCLHFLGQQEETKKKNEIRTSKCRPTISICSSFIRSFFESLQQIGTHPMTTSLFDNYPVHVSIQLNLPKLPACFFTANHLISFSVARFALWLSFSVSFFFNIEKSRSFKWLDIRMEFPQGFEFNNHHMLPLLYRLCSQSIDYRILDIHSITHTHRAYTSHRCPRTNSANTLPNWRYIIFHPSCQSSSNVISRYGWGLSIHLTRNSYWCQSTSAEPTNQPTTTTLIGIFRFTWNWLEKFLLNLNFGYQYFEQFR